MLTRKVNFNDRCSSYLMTPQRMNSRFLICCYLKSVMSAVSHKSSFRRSSNYYEEWIERKISPLVRLSTAKRHRLCFEAIILPELAAALFQAITKTRLEAFRAKLLRGRTQRGTTRAVKAVRNVVDWHLQSLWRDAEREGYAGPFPRLDWPRTHRARPRPL
jgi:hypothetical protein